MGWKTFTVCVKPHSADMFSINSLIMRGYLWLCVDSLFQSIFGKLKLPVQQILEFGYFLAMVWRSSYIHKSITVNQQFLISVVIQYKL